MIQRSVTGSGKQRGEDWRDYGSDDDAQGSKTIVCQLRGGPFHLQKAIYYRPRQPVFIVLTKFLSPAIENKRFDEGHVYASPARWTGQERITLEYRGTVAELRK